MRTPSLFRLLFAVLFLLVLGASPVRAERLLRWKFTSSQKLRLRTTQTMNMSAEVGGNEIKSTTEMAMTVSWTVESVAADGSAKVAQTIDRLGMKMTMPEPIGTVRIDTADTEEPNPAVAELAKSFKSLIGVAFRQTVSPRGDVCDIEMPGLAADAAAKAVVGDLVGEDGLADMFRRTALVLPEAPIDAGHRWTETVTMKSPLGEMHLDKQFRYLGTELAGGLPLERVSVAMTVRFGDEPSQFGTTMKVTDQDNSGTVYFDAVAGRIARSELNQKMTVELTVGDQTIEQKINTVTKMQVTPAPARPERGPAPRR